MSLASPTRATALTTQITLNAPGVLLGTCPLCPEITRTDPSLHDPGRPVSRIQNPLEVSDPSRVVSDSRDGFSGTAVIQNHRLTIVLYRSCEGYVASSTADRPRKVPVTLRDWIEIRT